MTSSISTLGELQTERLWLRAKLKETERSIKDDLRQLEHTVKPVIHDVIHETRETITPRTELVSNIISVSAVLGVDLLINRTLLKNSSFLKKMIVSALVQNGLPYLMGKIPIGFILKLKSPSRRR